MRHGLTRRSGAAALVLAASAALVAGCDVVVNSMDSGRARAERVWERSYTLTGPGARVEVVNVNGAITVETVDGDTLDVKARIVTHGASDEAARDLLKQVEIREDASAGSVRLQAAYSTQPRRVPLEVTYTIRAPRTAVLKFETVNGGVTVNGAAAGLTAETTNGSIEGQALGGDVEATTTNGSIKVQMAALGGGGVSLETTNGSVDLRLPADAKATLSARCVNGGIAVNDLPFERSGEGSRRKLDGTINGGGAAVRLESVNGRIRVGRIAP